jgi:hypothetical protein
MRHVPGSVKRPCNGPDMQKVFVACATTTSPCCSRGIGLVFRALRPHDVHPTRFVTETTVMGAAYLAGLAVGYWDSIEEIAANWRLDRRFEPKMSADKRKVRYAGWQEASRRAAGWPKS